MNWRTQSDSCWRGSILRLSIPAYSHSCRWCLKFYINKTFLKISSPWFYHQKFYFWMLPIVCLGWQCQPFQRLEWKEQRFFVSSQSSLVWIPSAFYHVNRGLAENSVYVGTTLSNFGSAHFGGLVGALLELIELTHRVEDETALNANMAKCTTDPGSLSSYLSTNMSMTTISSGGDGSPQCTMSKLSKGFKWSTLTN